MNKILCLLIILLVIILVRKLISNDLINEKFIPYQTYPKTIYQKWNSGSQPLNYYNYPIYRKPYRTGFVYDQSYPFPHKNSLGFEPKTP